ncbi:hypothetical protein TWF730_002551 [Orbilia blumenaviensis]|uniref:Uncharacterized protein n=1 Tax=Orbilia blumenaviensis TaxID=1796055 RepID=A0AAV9UAZ6_9PEZI
MDKLPNRCLRWHQGSFGVLFFLIVLLYSRNVAAWYQLNLFKDRPSWWNRADISAPAEVMAQESNGYACTSNNRPLDASTTDSVVIWNRPGAGSTIVKAVAFYDDQNCGTTPDPITGRLPLPSTILIMNLASPNGVTYFSLGPYNLEFQWGSYRALDVAAERNPRKILSQFTGEPLSDTIIRRNPTPISAGKPYLPPVKVGANLSKSERFQLLRRIGTISSMLRHIGESGLLPESKRNDKRVQAISSILMSQMGKEIREESEKLEPIRQILASSPSAVGGASGAIPGISMIRNSRDPSSGLQGDPSNLSNLRSGTQPNSQIPGLNLGQEPSNYPGSIKVIPREGQILPTYDNEDRPESRYVPGPMPQGNSQASQNNIPQVNSRTSTISPTNLAGSQNPPLNLGSSYASTEGSQQPASIGSDRDLNPGGRSGPSGPSRDRIVQEASATGNNNQFPNLAPAAGGESRPENQYIVPNLPPIGLHPEILNALLRGDNPDALASRQVDVTALLRSYQGAPDKKRWMATIIAMTKNAQKVYAIANQIYDLGQKRVIPAQGGRVDPLRGPDKDSGAGGVDQNQGVPPSNPVYRATPPAQEQLPNGGQPQNGAVLGQQRVVQEFGQRPGSTIPPNVQVHRPDQMQIELPQDEASIDSQLLDTRPGQLTGAGASAVNRPSTQMLMEPSSVGLENEQGGPRGQPPPTQQIQNTQPQTVNTGSLQGGEEDQGQPRDASVESGPPVNLGEWAVAQQPQAPHVFRMGNFNPITGGAPAGRPVSQQGLTDVQIPPRTTSGTENAFDLDPENRAATEQERPLIGGTKLPPANNVRWLQEQLDPFKRQSVPTSQIEQSYSGDELPATRSLPGTQLVSQEPVLSTNQGPGTKQGNIVPRPNRNLATNVELQAPDQGGQVEPSVEENPLPAGRHPSSFALDYNRDSEAVPSDGDRSASAGLHNIPAMFQREVPSQPSAVSQEQGVPSQSNQQLFNRPSVGQLRPSRGNTPPEDQQTGAIPEVQLQSIPRPSNIETEEEEEISPANGQNGPRTRILQGANESEEGVTQVPSLEMQAGDFGTRVSSPNSDLIDFLNNPGMFGLDQEEPDRVPIQDAEERGLEPVGDVTNSVVPGLLQGEAPKENPQANLQGAYEEPEVEPAPENFLGRQSEGVLRDPGLEPPGFERVPQPLFPSAATQGMSNLIFPDEQLLRPPPMRVPLRGLVITKPIESVYPETPGSGLDFTLSRSLAQQRETDNYRRAMGAKEVPGYTTPLYLRSTSTKPDPVLDPFLEEDNTPLRPLAMMENMEPNTNRKQVWDSFGGYEFTDPMLDRGLAMREIEEDRERRQRSLDENPRLAWRNYLAEMAKLQQQRRMVPEDVPSWSGPQFLEQEFESKLDPSNFVIEEDLNAFENPDDYDWNWDEVEKTLRAKKIKPSPDYQQR